MNLILKNKRVLFILSLIAIFFSFKITQVPPGINGDEASIGYNAILISEKLHDENNRLLPIFIATLNQKDWKQPVTVYLTALLFRFFGASYFMLRFVSVIFLITTVLILVLLGKEILDERFSWFAVVIFLSSPLILIQSHLALENIAQLPFIAGWLLFLFKFEKHKRVKDLIISAVFLGIGLFSYYGMRLVTPVLLILSLGLINWPFKKLLKKESVIFSASFLLFLSFLLSTKFWLPGAIFGATRPVNISSYQDFFKPFISSFDPSFLFISGDETIYHSTGRHGIFLLATLPLFLFGLFESYSKKIKLLLFLGLLILLGPSLFGIVGSVHRASRLIFLTIPYSLIASFGLISLLNLQTFYLKKGLISLLLIILVFNYGEFLVEYYKNYPSRVSSDFSKPLDLGFKKLKNYSQDKDLIPAVEIGLYNENNIASKFFEKAHFKSLTQIDSTTEPSKGMVILARQNQQFDGKDLKKIDSIGTLDIFIYE